MDKRKPKIQNRSTKGDTISQELPLACSNEPAAVEFLEKRRWNGSPCCPKCGSVDVYQMKDSQTGERQKDFRWRCKDCKSQYTVRTGTVFEESRIPLRHWCFAFWRAATSKKGVSALEIHRQTGISYKSALFMLHRIRFAMAEDGPNLRGDVEIDEAYIGGKPRNKGNNKRGKGTKKTPIVALVQRGGKAKVTVMPTVNGKNIRKFARAHIDRRSRIITDEHAVYPGIGLPFQGGHETVNHRRNEYVRGDIHSNTVESFFATVKRGITGIYHSVSKEHLHRYLAEYEFRYNHRQLEDGDRIEAAIKASQGKRLHYKEPVH